jgi:hypothetical protein
VAFSTVVAHLDGKGLHKSTVDCNDYIDTQVVGEMQPGSYMINLMVSVKLSFKKSIAAREIIPSPLIGL